MTATTIQALIGLVVVDALNPATIVQATILAAGRRPVRDVVAFWSGALSAYALLGVALLLGPAELIAGALTDPPTWLRAVGLVVGPAFLAGGVLLWRRRSNRTSGRKAWAPTGRAAFTMGLATTAVDAFTAVPYFAAAALIAATDLALGAQLGVLLLYNVGYLAPVLIVLALRLGAGARGERLLARVPGLVAAVGPALTACLLTAGGITLIVIGLRAVV